MINLIGKYNTAKVFTDNVESTAQSQILELCNQEFVQGGKIRIMPDTHAGSGCVIGFTADLGNKVIPNIVGVDIGCGMLTIELGKIDIDLKRLDNIIRQCVPSGKYIHEGRVVKFDELQGLKCYWSLKNTKRIERSIGTLGGGNHFIEVNQDSNENLYIVIHSGSRNLGKQVAEYYQNLAIDLIKGKEEYVKEKERVIEEYKKQGKKHLIQSTLQKLDEEYQNTQPDYPLELCFLQGEGRDRYLHDMDICQKYALLNREVMANIILIRLLNKSLLNFNYFQTVHNYISFKDNIIRKGAISAYRNEKVLIPINMRDGSIIAIGKGNPDWNYSAPHGAGRLMSRTKARELITLEDFKETMKDVYTTSVSQFTLDESPMAYKPIKDIIGNIGDTVEVVDIIKPIYNYKAGE